MNSTSFTKYRRECIPCDKVNMPAPQNPSDSKIEQEEGDQSQPMDLAQRISLSSAAPMPLPAPTGPVTMRTHIDPSKPGFMTLHMRVPARPSAQAANQIIGSSNLMPASIATAQHLTRPALRISGENPQCHTGSPAVSAFSSTPSSYAPPPSSAALASVRHVPVATMHPVTLGTSSNATMASIIRGNHTTQPAGHLISTTHLPYSSHVPRGPAAVANISAAPKSAVATPILRPAHTAAPVTLPVPVSAAISSSHIQITPRPAAVTGGRTITPPMPKSASPSPAIAQVIDLQKSAHGPVSHLAQTRNMEPTVWAGIPHGPATNKQVHISQPVVQHIQQQVSEQGFYKSSSPIASIITTTTTHQVSNTAVSIVSSLPSVSPSSNLSIIHHSSMPPTSAAIARPCSASPVVTICATPISTPSTQSGGMTSSRTTLVQPQPLQVITHTTSSPLTAHPTVTVVSGKSIPQMVHTVTPLQQQPTQAVTIAAPPTRTTKVYPQQLPTTTHSVLEPSENRNIYVAQPQQNLTCCANTVTTVVLSENCNEGGASMRLASLPRAGVAGGSSFTVPYYSVGRTITMHPYTGSAPSQGFTAAIASTPAVRPGIIAQQASGSLVTTAQTSSHTVVTTNVAPVRPLNSVMVTVDPSRHHVALHSTYGSSAGAGLPTSDATSSQVTSTGSAMYTVTNSVNPTVGLLPSGYGSQQGQNTLPNHSTSPRPSILRKRTSEGITSVAKKNLLASLPPSGPTSPHLEMPNSGNANTISSPKPQSSDHQRENGSTASNTGSDGNEIRNIQSISILPAVQESLDTTDQSSGTSIEMPNKLMTVPSVPVEASPRKKPRKQQLAANELIEAHSSDGEDDFEKDVKDTIRKEAIKEEEENVKWISYCKRPKISLMTGYHHAWKSRHNHFAKYTDVKPKEEKRQTVNDLANQKGVLQKANGWKIFHLTTQMDEVVELEDSVYGRLSELLNFVENNPPAWKTKPLTSDEERVLNKISDLIKGNLQRSKIVQDQVGEAKQQVLKMLEHKPHIIDIISKYISKRTLRKKEKN